MCHADGMSTHTPQQAVTEFLTHWQAGAYNQMARLLPKQGTPLKKPPVGQVRQIYRVRTLQTFVVLAAADTDPAAANVDVQLVYAEAGELHFKRWRFRMVHFGKGEQPVPRNMAQGRWKAQATYLLPDPPALRA
ncbi:MAG: hypothetical protein JWQ08_2314 [Deinococcus sp.]|nr:hypothetical protein [Deinococcus sp.]